MKNKRRYLKKDKANTWDNAKDVHMLYFKAMYYVGLLSYNKKTGRFTNTRTGTVYGPTTKKKRTQITLYRCNFRGGRRLKVNILAYRLAFSLFKGDLLPGEQINHMDGDQGNDRLPNLEKTTNAGNQKHAYAMGLRKAMRGDNNPVAILTEAQVRKIKLALRKGTMGTVLAARYKISNCTISNIKHGYSWSSVEI